MGTEKMTTEMPRNASPFNSALETGVRTLVVLEASFPEALSLERLVEFDYLVVHTGDAGGPESLHVSLPLRTGELLVRRGLIESGLALMMSRGLVKRITGVSGISYQASESAGPFLGALSSSYIGKLKERAEWLVRRLGRATDQEIHGMTRKLLNTWTIQFQPVELPFGEYL